MICPNCEEPLSRLRFESQEVIDSRGFVEAIPRGEGYGKLLLILPPGIDEDGEELPQQRKDYACSYFCPLCNHKMGVDYMGNHSKAVEFFEKQHGDLVPRVDMGR